MPPQKRSAETLTAAGSWLAKYTLLIVLIALLGSSLQAFAQTAETTEPPSFVNQKYLTGDWGGERTTLENKGISFDVFLQSDMMGAVSGGNSQGFGVWDRVRPTMDIDMNKLVHLKGMSLHITSTWNNGTDVARYLGAIGNATGNDTGKHQFRLDSFWVKQDLFNSKVSLYAGQISGFDFFGFVPSEFSHFAMLGPFYAPLALYNNYSSWDPNTTPAAMVQITPNKHFYYRSMIQSITHDNLTRNPSGTSLEARDGALWNNEVAFMYGQAGKDASVKAYPGEVHFGVGYSGAKAFTDFKTGVPAFTKNSVAGYENYYGTIKQAVWRPTAGSDRGLDLRATIVYGPADKGVLDFNRQYIATAVFNGLIPQRPKDSFNFGWNYYGVRGPLQTANYTSERAYEFNYAAQVTGFMNIMPVVQVYQNIGANPTKGNGVVLGVRSIVHF